MNFVALSIAADSAAPQRLLGWPYFGSSVTGTSVTESTGKPPQSYLLADGVASVD